MVAAHIAACALIVVALAAGRCAAASRTSASASELSRLAASQFPSLTRAELALLSFISVRSPAAGDLAVCGTSADPADPSNDPKSANEWGREREVRAALIEWLCTDPDAIRLVTPRGIRMLGARIIGALNLSHLRVPFPIVARKCAFPERIHLVATEIPHLDLNGSYVDEIDGKGLAVHSDLNLGGGFHASGETRLENSRIDGDLYCGGGSFHFSNVPLTEFAGNRRPALVLDISVIGGDLILYRGFASEGAVLVREASVAGGLMIVGRLSNPNNSAIRANNSTFGGVMIGGGPAGEESATIDGSAEFDLARVRSFVAVTHVKFLGASDDVHGFSAQGLTVGSAFLWQDVRLENAALLNLSGAQLGILVDEEKSWPQRGKLMIAGLSYTALVPAADVSSRLHWISLEPTIPGGGFDPSPYRQLAKMYKDSGFDSEARQVLIAEEDARYATHRLPGRILGGFLKYTIGYGHHPLLALLWSLAIVLIGCGVVRLAADAAVMRRTYPENAPAGADIHYERLYPLLYSLDVFLPFVNLHQEHYWWPDAGASGRCRVLRVPLNLSGAIVLYYLWAQIIAGWLLSAIFVAGVTGLVRSE